MNVSDILRVKGSLLYTVPPDEELGFAMQIMVERDIGSLIVIDHGDVSGILTFREVMYAVHDNPANFAKVTVRSVMDDAPMTCTMQTSIDEVRRMMLEHHTRYMPVMDQKMLMGVISLYDVAKMVVDSQNFENKLLKSYIKDWPKKEE